jgi:hypothetical protein
MSAIPYPAHFMSPALCLAALLAASPALAETCKYEDEGGRVTYSNVALKGIKKLNCFGEPPSPVFSVPTPTAGAAPKATPEKFPKVDGETQKKRDATRRKILEEELTEEEKLLAEAKRALAEQEAVRLGDERNYQKFLDRVQPYKDAVALHEKNVAALNEELARLR